LKSKGKVKVQINDPKEIEAKAIEEEKKPKTFHNTHLKQRPRDCSPPSNTRLKESLNTE
jgi:hypothetical protein